jgi:hypothetical protein
MQQRFLFIFLVSLLVSYIGFSSDSALSADCVPYAPLYQDTNTQAYGAGGAPWNLGKPASLWSLCDNSNSDFVPNSSCCLKSKIGLKPYEIMQVLLKMVVILIITICLHLSAGLALIFFIK